MELADFQQRVGWRLGIIRAAESLSPENARLIADAYGELWHELIAHELVNWSQDADIPDAAAELMIGMTAARLVDEFGMPEPRRSALIAECKYGMPVATPYERRLRALAEIGFDGEAVQADYY